MTAPVEPEIREKIDLSWVTFAEENPKEPCRFYECDQNADWMITTVPCSHQYPFCEFHTSYTRDMLSAFKRLMCTDCYTQVEKLHYDPIKRG